jgi:DNA polymerase-3 subunit alpha
VEVIIAERDEGGPFQDIDDFCQRVDLRLVNRRALECLIKAGALSSLGTRAQLLAVLDRMISISQQAHGAAQQYTMFDMPAFASSARLATDMPDVADVSRREMLAWEKELIGAYISDHPLTRVWADLENAITVLTGEIDESMTGKDVTVAGLVTYVRPHLTKKGAPMAFSQIEDLQGSLDVVVFPRVWEQTRELWQPERVLILRGKVNFRGREPSLLVDSATNEVLSARPREQVPQSPPAPRSQVHLLISVPRTHDLAQLTRQLGRIVDLLRSFSGEDQFSLCIENGGKGRVQIDFPNDTTHHCPELEQQLRALEGVGSISVEPAGGGNGRW